MTMSRRSSFSLPLPSRVEPSDGTPSAIQVRYIRELGRTRAFREVDDPRVSPAGKSVVSSLLVLSSPLVFTLPTPSNWSSYRATYYDNKLYRHAELAAAILSSARFMAWPHEEEGEPSLASPMTRNSLDVLVNVHSQIPQMKARWNYLKSSRDSAIRYGDTPCSKVIYFPASPRMPQGSSHCHFGVIPAIMRE